MCLSSAFTPDKYIAILIGPKSLSENLQACKHLFLISLLSPTGLYKPNSNYLFSALVWFISEEDNNKTSLIFCTRKMKLVIFASIIGACLAGVPICGDNEEYTDCISACPVTCPTGSGNLVMCTQDCKPAGCKCKQGYVRRSDSDHTCISQTECPLPSCGENEEYTDCMSSYCPATCRTGSDSGIICPCESASCKCKQGYVRRSDSDHTCIMETECPPKCSDPNEIFVDASSCASCISYCHERGSITCNADCRFNTCECKAGYLRRSAMDRTCILIDSCPAKCTDPNEIFVDASGCASCISYCHERGTIACNLDCRFNICECKAGYLRRSAMDRTCILIDSCPAVPCQAPVVDHGSTSAAENGMVADRGILLIECDDGYKRRGPRKNKCINGSFTKKRVTRCMKVKA